MKKIFVYLLLAAMAAALIWKACPNDPPPPVIQDDPTPKKNVDIPRFHSDSALSFIAKQVDFGPRVPNSAAHKSCKQWLVNKLKSYGATVYEQDFKATQYTGTVLNGTNIVAAFNPQATNRMIIAAHWDSRFVADHDTKDTNKPILGADDGASGVGVIIELARQLQAKPTQMGVDLVLFDAEDNGKDNVQTMEDAKSWCLGSQHWAKTPHINGYRAKFGILLDMVGATGARFSRDQISMQYAAEYTNKVWKMAEQMGYGAYFVPELSGPMTDDHLFVNEIAGIPMMDIINRSAEGGFASHWHTHNDNMKAIDRETIRVVGQLMLSVLYHEDANQF